MSVKKGNEKDKIHELYCIGLAVTKQNIYSRIIFLFLVAPSAWKV